MCLYSITLSIQPTNDTEKKNRKKKNRQENKSLTQPHHLSSFNIIRLFLIMQDLLCANKILLNKHSIMSM